MIETRTRITADLADRLESAFCETYQQCWMLHENWKTGEQQLRGFFDTHEAALTEHDRLAKEFPELGAIGETRELEDKDWKEAYKRHFKPWSDRGLHWVPIWEKDTYALPEGEQIVYLDPGMAFGTGNHETTRLCVMRLLDARDAWESTVADKAVIDAGCGSGILAISARKLGFRDCYGFDNDPDSVRISMDNEALCDLQGSVTFLWADLIEGLSGREADLVMANILSPILIEHRENLVQALRPGGRLVLSGILAREVEAVHEAFAPEMKRQHGVDVPFDSRQDGDWADLLYRRPEDSHS